MTSLPSEDATSKKDDEGWVCSEHLSVRGYCADDIMPAGARVVVYVGTIVSPSCFFVSPMRSVQMLSPHYPGPVRRVYYIEQALCDASLLPLTKPPQRLDLVAVEVFKRDWRRGKVFKLKDGRAELLVFLLDTGNIVEVTADRLRALPVDMVAPPFLSQKLLITDMETLGDKGVCKEWSPSATTLVRDLVHCAEQVSVHLPSFEPSARVLITSDMFVHLPETTREEDRIVRKYRRLLDGQSVVSVSSILRSAGYAAANAK